MTKTPNSREAGLMRPKYVPFSQLRSHSPDCQTSRAPLKPPGPAPSLPRIDSELTRFHQPEGLIGQPRSC